MKKFLVFWAALFASSVVCAQEQQYLGKEDVLAAFKKYNPVALEKAAASSAYQEILEKLANAYSAPRTEANQLELIALVKNFDNSLLLQSIKNKYQSGRDLQTASGIDLSALENETQKSLRQVFQYIFKNTVEVKNIQLQQYRHQVKETKKDSSLDAQQRAEKLKELRAQVGQVKKEIKALKKDSSKKIKETADTYFAEMRLNYEQTHLFTKSAVENKTLSAAEANNLLIKTNNKKPVAK